MISHFDIGAVTIKGFVIIQLKVGLLVLQFGAFYAVCLVLMELLLTKHFAPNMRVCVCVV